MKGQTCLKPMGPMKPPHSEAQPPHSEAQPPHYVALGWQPAHACGCMSLWQMIFGAFIGRMHFFGTFLINLINVYHQLQWQRNLPFPGLWTKGQNLLLGAVFGWDHQSKLHTLGRTQLWGQAHWQGGMLAAQRRKFP